MNSVIENFIKSKEQQVGMIFYLKRMQKSQNFQLVNKVIVRKN